jgi:hypothetical protein
MQPTLRNSATDSHRRLSAPDRRLRRTPDPDLRADPGDPSKQARLSMAASKLFTASLPIAYAARRGLSS